VRFTPTRPGTPVASTLVAEKVQDVTPATTYVVKAGDSLWSIAKKHKLTVSDLTAANGIAANTNLQPGKKLLIPAKSSPGAATPAPTPAPASAKAVEAPAARAGADAIKHTVKSGETLGSIARNYGVRQSDIAVANHISDPAKIQAGMELIIPGWQATAGKSAKAAAKGSAKAETKPEPTPAAPPAAPIIPVIRLDESPVTPAPKR
jgi:LysM repeat protein